MKPELISKLTDSLGYSLDVAAAFSFANSSELGYWLLRARGLNCHRSHRALFSVLVGLLKSEAGHVLAERLAGVILAETLNPRRCRTCNGAGDLAGLPCSSCDGAGYHWLGERQIAGLLGLTRYQVRRAGFSKTIRAWAVMLLVLEAETAKNAVLDD